jgi:hypothetical protein
MAILHFRCKERRRTMRVMLSVPLRVHGITSEGETYAVETKSHTVSLHGASIELEHSVALGDILLLENKLTEEQAEGKVVDTDFSLNFWHMAFPTPGAKPLRRRYAEKVAALS